MGAFQNLFVKDTKKDIGLYVAEGAIIMQNSRIMLKSISTLDIVSPPKQSLVAGVVELIMGVLMYLVRNEMLQILGVMLVVLGIFSMGMAFLANKFMVHTLKLQMDSGRVIGFQSRNEAFLRRFMEEVALGVKDNTVRTYIDMRNSHIEENVKNINIEKLYEQTITDGSIFNGDIHIGKGNMGNIFLGKQQVDGDVSSDHNTDSSQYISVLSEQQWSILETFFEKRLSEMELGDPHRKQCLGMRKYVQQKNASGLKEYMHAMGKAGLSAVLGSGASQVVKQLLAIILQNG